MRSSFLFLLFLFLAFPLFYFAYKFGDPDQVAHDFYHYYALYLQFDVTNTKAPFNMRLVGAFFIFIIYQSGIYYDTETRFDAYAPYMKEDVWFAAVFFNFLMVAATATLIAKIYENYFQPNPNKDPLHAVLAGAIYLLGFGTLFFDLMPLTEAASTCLFAGMIWLLLKGSYWLLPVMALCVFQREYLLVLIGLLAIGYEQQKSRKYYIVIIGWSLILFLTYFFIRGKWFYNPELNHQTSVLGMMNQMKTLGVSISVMLKQSMMSLNVVLLYLILFVYKRFKRMSVYSLGFKLVIGILFVTLVVTLAGGLGTNFGRLFYLASPLVACLLVKEAAGLTVSTGQSTGN